MSSESVAPRSWRLAFAGVSALVVVEILLLVTVDTTPFTIRGHDTQTVHATHDAGLTIEHSFLMRGEGLRAVAVELNAGSVMDTTIEWTLWRGHKDRPASLTPAARMTESVRLHRGRQWVRLPVTRDASSHDRWYTIEMRLPGSAPPHQQDRRVGVMASRDNPARGGVLWIDGNRQPGSLHLRAERRGRSLQRRFAAEVEPNLPAVLRNPLAQVAIAILFHWAVFVTGLALVDDVWAARFHRKS